MAGGGGNRRAEFLSTGSSDSPGRFDVSPQSFTARGQKLLGNQQINLDWAVKERDTQSRVRTRATFQALARTRPFLSSFAVLVQGVF